MKVLVLGGGVFLGRHAVATLLERGHAVTTFTRGRHPLAAAPNLTQVVGDRDGGLDALQADRWDAVIDTCGYVPRIVAASVERLRSAGHYAFVSSVSVYDESAREPREGDPTAPLPGEIDPADETVDGKTYGPLKAACENVVSAAFGDRALVVRPGLIVGPNDPSDRFTYWPERLARGGDVLAPGPPARFVQVIDVRDLATFMVRALEDGRGGVVNATGAQRTTTMGDVVEASRAAAGTESKIEWVDDALLESAGVEPWMGLPLWIPDSLGLPGLSNTNVDRALSWGLHFRALRDTVADTLAWVQTLPADRPRKAGLDAAREAELLQRWRAAT